MDVQQRSVMSLCVSEVLCVCKPGYIGDGLICTGNLLQVLRSTPTFSNFLIVSITSSVTAQLLILLLSNIFVFFSKS